jgi:hypothetical protein
MMPTQGVALAALAGIHEAEFGSGSGAADALALLEQLANVDVATLDVTTADRWLAMLYEQVYDDRAECRTKCSDCGVAYEFTLSLRALIAAQDAERPPPDAEGGWVLDDGRRVRAPRHGDLIDCSGDSEALLTRLVSGPTTGVAEFLERAAPVLSLDLTAACPHCSAANVNRFDLAAYLAARLAAERPFLTREIHLIASRYHWSRAEILSMTRVERRAHAGLIEAERATALRSVRARA